MTEAVKSKEKGVPKPTLSRLPAYLDYLKKKQNEGTEYISTTKMGNDLELYHVQVRKDLAYVGASGKPKTGYEVNSLISNLENFLGYEDIIPVVLAGAGQLGRTFMCYDGFAEYGVKIVAAFDIDEKLIGQYVNGKPILNIKDLPDICRELNIRRAIITTPASAAQEVAGLMINSGVEAIWNFAPTYLVLPKEIVVLNENFANSIAILRNKLKEKGRG